MKTIIHVNQHVLKANAKDGGDRPVLTVKRGKKNNYCHEAEIDGPAKIVYGNRQLGCGARCWVETSAEVRLVRR